MSKYEASSFATVTNNFYLEFLAFILYRSLRISVGKQIVYIWASVSSPCFAGVNVCFEFSLAIWYLKLNLDTYTKKIVNILRVVSHA